MDEVVLRLVPGGDDSGSLDDVSFGKISYSFSGASLGTEAMEVVGAAPCSDTVQSGCMDGNAYYLSLDGTDQTVDLKAGAASGSLEISGDFPGRVRIELFSGS